MATTTQFKQQYQAPRLVSTKIMPIKYFDSYQSKAVQDQERVYLSVIWSPP